jgi:hypothetical protein
MHVKKIEYEWATEQILKDVAVEVVEDNNHP